MFLTGETRLRGFQTCRAREIVQPEGAQCSVRKNKGGVFEFGITSAGTWGGRSTTGLPDRSTENKKKRDRGRGCLAEMSRVTHSNTNATREHLRPRGRRLVRADRPREEQCK